MTTSDQLALVEQRLAALFGAAGVISATALADAGMLVNGWMKARRLLVTLAKGNATAVAVFLCGKFPIESTEELSVENVINVDSDFR